MAGMKFTKMHGLGNDYVYVNAFAERVGDAPSLARRVSDRHRGIGGDGLILIGPSSVGDVRMEMYNADGSRAEMCGNGLRCVAKYAFERRLVDGPEVSVETDAGLRRARCNLQDGTVRSVRVDMDVPAIAPESLPSTLQGERIVDHPLAIDGSTYNVTCVSLGNPHAVIFVDDLESIDLPRVGPRVENAAVFPRRINAHFARVDSPRHVTMRTWERGSGETNACGTGACAVGVAGVLCGRTMRSVIVTLPGGDLEIEWGADDHVFMTGPAEEVFTGEYLGGNR